MTGDLSRAETQYTFGEARSLLAPMLGWQPEQLRAFVVIGIDRQGRAGVGGSPGFFDDDSKVLRTLEGVARHLRDRGVS